MQSDNMKTKQRGLSPKLLSDLLTSVVTFVLAYYALDVDADTSAFIAKGIGFVVGVIVPPGKVEQVPA